MTHVNCIIIQFTCVILINAYYNTFGIASLLYFGKVECHTPMSFSYLRKDDPIRCIAGL